MWALLVFAVFAALANAFVAAGFAGLETNAVLLAALVLLALTPTRALFPHGGEPLLAVLLADPLPGLFQSVIDAMRLISVAARSAFAGLAAGSTSRKANAVELEAPRPATSARHYGTAGSFGFQKRVILIFDT